MAMDPAVLASMMHRDSGSGFDGNALASGGAEQYALVKISQDVFADLAHKKKPDAAIGKTLGKFFEGCQGMAQSMAIESVAIGKTLSPPTTPLDPDRKIISLFGKGGK